MYKYVVEKSTVNYQWKYKRMLPSLPGPGSEAFAVLCKQLHPFGLSPENMTIDGSSSRMSEITIGMALLENRMMIRLTPGLVDIFVSELLVSDETPIVEIVSFLIEAVSKIDEDAVNGVAEVRNSLHLSLPTIDVKTYLSNVLVESEFSSDLVPVTIVYQVDKSTGINADSIRLLLAKSLMYDGAIFLDINSSYNGPLNVPLMASWLNEDFSKATSLIRLTEEEARP